MSYFLMINSKDCANFYEHNAPYDFTIELPHELELGEKWECALTQINFNNTFEISQKVQEIYVFVMFVKIVLLEITNYLF